MLRISTLLAIIFATSLPESAFSQGGVWDAHTSLPINLTVGQADVIDGRLYVVGGSTSTGPTNALYVYDSATDVWDATKAPSPTLRQGGAAVALDGLLYLIGGCDNGDGNIPTNRVDVYDPVLNLWTNLTPMPTARCKLSAAAIDGKIYVVGGFSAGYMTRTTLEIYDPDTNTWLSSELAQVAAMPTAREGLGAVAIAGRLYVVGGFLRPSSVVTSILEVYDPAMDSWSTSTNLDVSAMSLAREEFAFGAIAGKLYVAGGRTALSTTDQLEAYDPMTDTWATLTSMPTSRGFVRAGVIGDQLFVVGGATVLSPFTITNVLESFTPDADGDGVPDDEDDFPFDPDFTTLEDFTLYLRDVLLDDEVILDSDLKNANQRHALQDKLTALTEILQDIEDAPDATAAELLTLEAIDSLEHDIIPKTDGFFGGNPSNDWVVTPDGQDLLYPELQLLLEALWMGI